MNKAEQAALTKLFAKDISALTSNDIKIMKARRSYIPVEKLDYYAPLFNEKKELTYKELYQKAKEKGLRLRVGMKREELERLVG